MSLLDSIKRKARPLICPFDPILDAIPGRSAVFDIGCGSGFLLGLIAERKTPKSLAGAEIDQKLVEAARNYLRDKSEKIPVSVNLFDGITLPAEVSNADIVTLVDVLHHVPPDQQVAFLQTTFQRMRPGAVFILKDIDAGRRVLCLANKFHDLVVTGSPGNELPKNRTKEILECAGFQILSAGEERKLWYPHYWFICRKPTAQGGSSKFQTPSTD